MDNKLFNHIRKLTLLNNQRRAWLVLSCFVIISIFTIIYDWSFVGEYHLVWAVICFGLLVSSVWWYWTMRLIKDLITQRKDEALILVDIVHHIREVQNEVRKLAGIKVDKDK